MIGTQVRSTHDNNILLACQADILPEIFLPSYVECDFESLERKRDPVHEIRLSDEEIKKMLPQ